MFFPAPDRAVGPWRKFFPASAGCVGRSRQPAAERGWVVLAPPQRLAARNGGAIPRRTSFALRLVLREHSRGPRQFYNAEKFAAGWGSSLSISGRR